LHNLAVSSCWIRQDHAVDDSEFTAWLVAELSALPTVVAVSLGGSRTRQDHHPDSDWDLAVYYRGRFEPDALRAKGWDGDVSEVGGWGGGVMNGGAWLTIDGRRVDVHYRDLDDVEYWCTEARAGRFVKQLLMFYAAGIPTYVVMGELALNVVLAGELPTPEYPDALATEASRRWRGDAIGSLRYAEAAVAAQGDVTVAIANAARGLVEAAHSRLAARKMWVLNEKGIAERRRPRRVRQDAAARHRHRRAQRRHNTDPRSVRVVATGIPGAASALDRPSGEYGNAVLHPP
jgi:predicted nucleotidyltransferase